MPILIAFDYERARTLVRDWSAQQLIHEIDAGRFGANLNPGEIEELSQLARAWMQRALGAVALRDAILVDPQRGARVYDRLCGALARGRLELPGEMAPIFSAGSGQPLRAAEVRARLQGSDMAGQVALEALLQCAENENLALAYADGGPVRFALPDLEGLLPAPPAPVRVSERFEPPMGWRWALAVLLVLGGVALLGIPLLLGVIPAQPAGAPLALMTLGLLVGIRAGWTGYGGALCIWLVANLPGFGHQRIIGLWPDVPLLLLGMALLFLDRRVRSMWRWLRESARPRIKNAE